MKKVFIDRNEPVASVVEKILSETEKDIVLVVPRNAKLGESVGNFHLLKREAGTAKKDLLIESVDEEVLALAAASKLDNVHPLFSGNKARSLSDIVPVEDEPRSKTGKRAKIEPPAKPAKKLAKKFSFKGSEEEAEAEERSVPEPEPENEPDEEPEFEKAAATSPRRFSKKWLVLGGALVLLGAAWWLLGTVFARAEVRINFQKIPWQFENDITAAKSAARTNADSRIFPGEVFRDRKNTTQFFPASGKAQTSEKAKGQLTIFNAYSSQPQSLVATTRFETPDGKIFRLDAAVVVPAAQIKDGKIIPASIKTQVTADKAGAEYDLKAVPKLTIPGFKGTPKFDGFYGVLEAGTTGGFIGEKAVPTESDISAAKAKTEEILRTILGSNLLAGRPKEFQIPEGASSIEIIRLTVNQNTDASGRFSVLGEAEFRAIGFREEDLRSLLLALAQRESPKTDFRKLEFGLEDIRPDYAAGELRLKIKAQGELTTAFDERKFREDAAGKAVEEVRSDILKLQLLENAKVSLWPLWLSWLPADPDRVRVTLE